MENDNKQQSEASLLDEETIDSVPDDWTEEDEIIYQKNSRLNYVLLAFLIVLLIAFGLGTYRLYPLQSKVEGKWINEENADVELTIKKKEVALALKNYQGVTGVQMIYTGDLKGVETNRYRGSNVQLLLVIDKSAFSKKELTSFKENRTDLKLVKEDKNELQMRYKQKEIEKLYEETNGIESVFYFILQDFEGLQGKELLLRNKQFAENGMRFIRQK